MVPVIDNTFTGQEYITCPYAGDIFYQAKRCVAFLFLLNDEQKIVPYGTGFFVRVLQEHNPSRGVGYFVTAKRIKILCVLSV
jgi:hypothetical protein